MQITRNSLDTSHGPSDRFTGAEGEQVGDEQYGQTPSIEEGEN